MIITSAKYFISLERQKEVLKQKVKIAEFAIFRKLQLREGYHVRQNKDYKFQAFAGAC
jgi:hypothetical protein